MVCRKIAVVLGLTVSFSAFAQVQSPAIPPGMDTGIPTDRASGPLDRHDPTDRDLSDQDLRRVPDPTATPDLDEDRAGTVDNRDREDRTGTRSPGSQPRPFPTPDTNMGLDPSLPDTAPQNQDPSTNAPTGINR